MKNSTHTFAEGKAFLNDLENKSKEEISLFLSQKPTLEKEEEKILENFEIGQKVEWTVGIVKSIGVALEDKDEVVTVITHYIGGVRSNREVEVLKSLLTKI